MEKKKGQASMEFLMTYGWAILAAVLAISVLAYYGVFSPGNAMPDICTINAPLGCSDSQVSAADGASIVLRNGAGKSITVSSFAIGGCDTNTSSVTIADGATQRYDLTCTGLTADEKFNGEVTITYMLSGGTFNSTSTGDLRETIVA